MEQQRPDEHLPVREVFLEREFRHSQGLAQSDGSAVTTFNRTGGRGIAGLPGGWPPREPVAAQIPVVLRDLRRFLSMGIDPVGSDGGSADQERPSAPVNLHRMDVALPWCPRAVHSNWSG